MNLQTPTRRGLQVTSSPVLERSLILNQKRRKLQNSFRWTTVNFLFLAILLYDLSYACPLYFNYYLYIEYSAVVILTLNLFYHVIRITTLSLRCSEPILITQEQKRLLKVKDSDPDYKIFQSPTKSSNTTPMTTFVSSPGNISSVSQLSNVSQMDSMNYSLSSPSWTYLKGTSETSMTRFSNRSSPITVAKASPMRTPFREASSVESITDETSLTKYLKEYEEMEKVNKLANKSQHSTNLLSSFWSHPVTKTAKDVSSFLKKCQYQLSTQLASKSPGSPNVTSEDKMTSSGQVSALEVWTRINVDSVALTQWNENLRVWISQTIIERLSKEFDSINDSLDKHGLSDIKIGGVGLERLRKTAQMSAVAQYIPSLPTLLPFLEITANQEYLVRRIRELAKGGCISEFKWNGGGGYNGKEWDVSLPTDCAIVMHLLAAYLDTQLMPLPNMPDTKAFSGHHYIKASEKMPELTSNSLFIQQVSELPPHYRVIVAGKNYEMVKGYNNLFHSILFFIYHVNKIEHGMLGRVNLGRAGVNILWVIDQ